MMKLSLFWKLMAAFVLVLAVSVGGVTLVARQTTTLEFQQYMGGGNADLLAAQLADYYAQNGSWNGVEAVLSAGGMLGGRGMMRGGSPGGPNRRLIVADARGSVVVDSGGTAGGMLPSSQLERGAPLMAGGQRVGTLLVSGGSGMGGMLGAAEQNFLDRVNRAVLIAGLVAGVVALLVGFIVFSSITAPLNKLARAAHAVAQGDLAQRVDIRTGDEIAELGAAFNTMAANLEHGEQLRREMTADIAHELRTPLSVIQGNLEAMLDGVYPADAEHIQPALNQAQLLARLIEDLRTLALADAGQLALNHQPTDAVGLVRRVVASFEPTAADRGIQLQVNAPASLPPVLMDGQRIAQVLTNLLGNALHYTPPAGRIEVSLTSENRFVTVAVRDTGSGIAAEDLPHIFDRLYRADKSRAREADAGAGGSGLGLAIARSIIQVHGGQIRAESEIGRGTTIAFTLPTMN
jgi:signal transduction histidine kinase